MSDIIRTGTTRRWSDSVSWNGLLFLCEVPTRLEGDISEQANEVFEMLSLRLSAAGSSTRRILHATIYLPRPAELAIVNSQWDDWIPNECAPVRTCVHAELTDPRMRIEIQLVAALN